MNKLRSMMKSKVLVIVFIILIALVGCEGGIPGSSPTHTTTLSPTSTLTPTQTPAPTLTPLPPVGVLWAPTSADPQLTTEIQSRLSQWIPEIGYRFQVRPSLDEGTLESDDFRLVVALPPNPDLEPLAGNHPEIQFLAVGIQGLEPAPNLTTIGADGERLDLQGFIAGYMAAMITPDWRVGVIGSSDSPQAVAARQAFFTGVKFYCGLCRSSYPPFYEYPFYFELGADADTVAWRTAADYMIQRSVGTLYIVPGAGDDLMMQHLADAGVNIIAGEPLHPELSDKWVASLRFDLLEAFIETWPSFIANPGNEAASIPLQLMDINSDLFSPGKQRLVQATLEDALAGYIDLGVPVQDTP